MMAVVCRCSAGSYFICPLGIQCHSLCGMAIAQFMYTTLWVLGWQIEDPPGCFFSGVAVEDDTEAFLT